MSTHSKGLSSNVERHEEDISSLQDSMENVQTHLVKLEVGQENLSDSVAELRSDFKDLSNKMNTYGERLVHIEAKAGTMSNETILKLVGILATLFSAAIGAMKYFL